MHWLNFVFFGLMFALGGAVCALHVRAKQVRAWIWAGIALVGAAGLVACIVSGQSGVWRSFAMCATFDLFAADHFVQYVQEKAAGKPRKIQLGLGVLWLAMGLLQLV